MTVKEFIPQYLEFKTKTCKRTSVAAYALIIREHILPIIGNYQLEDITNKEAELLKSECERKKLSRKTTGDVIIVFKNILRIARFLEVAETRDVSVIWGTRNEEQGHKIEAYNRSHVGKLVDYLISNPSFANLGLLLTIYSGMRIGEICALQWKNVNLNEKVIYVRQTISRAYDLSDVIEKGGHTELLITTPKTSSSNREIPISPKIYKILKDFSRICKPEYFVCSGTSKPIEPRTYRNHYKRVLGELGLPYLKFHGLRHTFATQMLASKADVKTLSTILGHSDISITLNTYVHPSLDDKMNAVKKLKF